VAVRPRKGSAAICSRCHQPAPGYDQLAERRFEFIPLWGFFVFLLYAMGRVDCRRCSAVLVEEVPWCDGKRSLTKAYMLFLARWARRLWKETAAAFHTSWEKVFDAVEHVVTWGLEHRTLGINNWDMALQKSTRIRENMAVEFRAEFFNLFNHTQFNNPAGNFSSGQFGQVTSARDPRIGQLAMKFLW
jgi:hypothetical protein